MFIRSERLFLRPIWPEDWAELHSGLSDGEVVKNLARVPWPYTPEAARGFAAASHHPRLPHFLITRPRGAHGVDALGVIGLADRRGRPIWATGSGARIGGRVMPPRRGARCSAWRGRWGTRC
jgi:RimJ/RimL family protein N-acetyltransferase